MGQSEACIGANGMGIFLQQPVIGAGSATTAIGGFI